jgi:hypothetical protein
MLEDHNVTDADVMARDGEGVRRRTGVDRRDWSTVINALTTTAMVSVSTFATHTDVDILMNVLVMMMVVIVEGVEDTVGGLVESVTDGVVATFFVVVTHVVLVLMDIDVYVSFLSSEFLSVDWLAALRLRVDWIDKVEFRLSKFRSTVGRVFTLSLSCEFYVDVNFWAAATIAVFLVNFEVGFYVFLSAAAGRTVPVDVCGRRIEARFVTFPSDARMRV